MTIIADIEAIAKCLAISQINMHHHYGAEVTQSELEEIKETFVAELVNKKCLDKANITYEQIKSSLIP